MRVLRIVVATLLLAGLIAGCGGNKVKTPNDPTPPPKDDPISTSAPSAPADE